jgi:hypothetical protein
MNSILWQYQKRALVTGVLLLLMVACNNQGSVRLTPQAGANYYVATNGVNTNPGTSASPFRTIQKCASTAGSGDFCNIGAGTYRETVTPNSGVTFRPNANATVTVDGSDTVSGWTLHSGNIYKVSNLTLNSSMFSNQIFVGTEAMIEARWPNTSNINLLDPTWAIMGSGTTTTTISDSNIPNIAGGWNGATAHIWSGSNPFGHQTATVTSSSSGQVTTNFSNSGTCPVLCAQAGGKYYLVGKLGALDSAREWFYDSTAQVLYFWAANGGLPSNVTVKQRDYAFDLRGKSNVTIQGLKLFANTVIMNSSSSSNLLDGINAKYLSHFETLPLPANSTEPYDVLVSRMSSSGIIMGGTGNTLKNSTLNYSAGDGVYMGGSQNRVENNLITNMGYSGSYSTAVAIPGSTGQVVTKNTIHSTGRDGINMNTLQSLTHNNEISYNNIYNTTKISVDAGGVYGCCSLNASGSRIHNNWIHDINQISSSIPTAGVYIDNSSGGFEIDQNVIWNAKEAGIYLHGNGGNSQNNNVHNNDLLSGQAKDLWLLNVVNASGTRLENNKLIGGITVTNSATGLVNSNNSDTSVGANTGYTASVGCNFSGCTSDGPPNRPGSTSSTVQNPGFEANGGFTWHPSGWLTAASNVYSDYAESGGRSGSYQGTHWSDKSYWAYTYQKLSSLANGTYTFKAWIKSSGGQNTAMMIVKTNNGGTTQTKNITAASGWTQVQISGINVNDGTAELAFYSAAAANQWLNMDDVEFIKN